MQISSPPTRAFFASAPDITPFEVERMARPMPSRTDGISGTDTKRRRPGFEMRFTSVMAHQTMIDAGLSKTKRQDKELVDTIAATIILQSYMESIKNRI